MKIVQIIPYEAGLIALDDRGRLYIGTRDWKTVLEFKWHIISTPSEETR